MEKYDLSKLPLLAQGGEADIYDIGDGKVLRVLRNPEGRSFKTEKRLFPILEAHQISVPKVYAYIEDDMTAITMQKITGTNMLEQLKRHPLKMVKGIKRFAGMHAQLLDIHSGGGLNAINDVVDRFVSQTPRLDEKLINFALQLLKELPVDDSVCHGDFHPGNILVQDGTYYMIDWGAAYCGSFLSDVAHTYLLMIQVPAIPSQSRLQHLMISAAGSMMAKTYLKQVLKLKKFKLEEFSKWTAVMALKRVYYGTLSERAARISYITKCYELSLKGADAATWYKRL